MYTVSQWLWLRVQQIGYHCLKAPHKATIKVLAESVVLLRGLMGGSKGVSQGLRLRRSVALARYKLGSGARYNCSLTVEKLHVFNARLLILSLGL